MSFQESDLVLVTGGNSHVAQHVIQQLLSISTGPKVRTSVRSSTSAQKLKDTFKSQKLEVVLIPNITVDGAFDSALKDVTHLAHVASPLIIGAKDIENELLIPAIKGTTGILESACKSEKLKSVVITSSFAAVVDAMHGWRAGHTYKPTDWNPITYSEASDPALDLSQWSETWRPYITYCASKKLAEKAAWDLWESERPKWDLSSILPTYIVGPCVLDISGPESLSFSNGLIWRTAVDDKLPAMDYPFWVDVRDVAKAHIRALQTPEARGKRFILAADSGMTYSDLAGIIRKNFDSLKPSTEKQEFQHYSVDTSNAKLIGIDQWIPIENSVVDLMDQILKAQS